MQPSCSAIAASLAPAMNSANLRVLSAGAETREMRVDGGFLIICHPYEMHMLDFHRTK